MVDEYEIELALRVLMNKIGEISTKYAEAKDEKEIQKYREKLDLLEEFKNEIEIGNEKAIKKILSENSNGII